MAKGKTAEVEENKQPTTEPNAEAADQVTEGLLNQLEDQLEIMVQEVAEDLSSAKAETPTATNEQEASPAPAQRDSSGGSNPFGVWDEVSSRKTGRNVLVYGGSGTGKTWFAGTWPKPLFLDLEGGLHSITHMKPMRFPKDSGKTVQRFEEISQFYKLAKAALVAPNCPFQTIVIDSLNELQQMVLNHVVEDFSANRLYDDQPTQADYGKALRDFIKIFRLFLKLPCHVLFLATDLPKQYPEEQSFPNFIGRKTAPEVMRLVDAIGFTYTTKSSGDTGEIKYLISFANTPDHIGKDRLGIGSASKPNNFQSVFRR